MSRETLELIQQTAQKAVERKLIACPNDPQMHLLISPDGVEKILTPFSEPARKHTVLSIADFAEAYKRWYLDGNDVGRSIAEAPELAATPSDDAQAKTIVDQLRAPNIWVDLDNWRLVFFVDEPIRRSWVKLALKPSPQFGTVFKFREAQCLEQSTLVRLLRHDLINCVDANVLHAFRSVDFQKIINARRNIQHERQSLDSDIVATVTGDKKPEEFLVSFPMLATRELDPFKATVRLTVDIDADKSRFILQAVPGELDLAMEELRQQVMRTLDVELSNRELGDVTVLCGSPAGSKTGDE